MNLNTSISHLSDCCSEEIFLLNQAMESEMSSGNKVLALSCSKQE